MDGNGSPIQVIISLRNDMMLEEKQTKAPVDVWNLHLHGNDRSLYLHINSCTASQELKLLENQWTTVKRAEERKTYKRQESDRSGHRFGAGLGGSDAFVSRSFLEKLWKSDYVFKSTIHTWVRKENGILCLLVIHVAFRSPLDLGTRGGSVALHLAGSG